MKKITFLVAALFATMAVSAAVITFDAPTIGDQGTSGTGSAVTKTVSGVTLSIDKGYVFNDLQYEVNYVRAYAGAAMTISSDVNITKIVVTAIAPVSETDDKYSAASFTSTGYTVSEDKTIGTWEGTSTSVSFAAAKQVRMTKIEVTIDGEIGGGETGGETVALDVNYAQAQYLEEYSSEGAFNWEFDLINATSETDYTAWMYIDLTTPTLNSIVGTWTASNGLDITYSGLDLINGTDTTSLTATDVTLTLTFEGDDVDGYPTYAVTASMTCDDGKTYTVTQTLTVYAFNATTQADLDMENASAISKIEVLNNVYANQGRIYTEESARIYTITGLDVTSMNGNLDGVYIVKVANKVAKIMVTK
jgi:hypothetical protein